ncbi:late embryogenesis abundant (LEA) hydroxyproline-rich glyco family [Olea europaea subsp. europaea]|uniref:Late embryogenesis abundant (LEA) hydroxyproline-rich glyco family n=1 Tax=Olea europaea subsp. europaea TaxID=158383 RepID=A0A8S0UEG7_OLEEU|nr:late embryogenesis abundant (LEA) hydroxyproline-rich glyco family [Olea europaea subsp. europaea]
MAPPPMQPPQATRPRHSPLVRCIAMVLLALVVVVGLAVLIIWVSVNPKKLKYSIEQGSISDYNLTSDGHLNANFHFVLRANNPNKRISIYYDRIEVTVSYEDQKLSINNVLPFYQRRHNVTYLDLDLAARDVTLYGAVARDLKMKKYSGKVDLDVKIRSKIRQKVGVFKIHRHLKIECGPLTVPFSSSKAEFERVFCDVDL